MRGCRRWRGCHWLWDPPWRVVGSSQILGTPAQVKRQKMWPFSCFENQWDLLEGGKKLRLHLWRAHTFPHSQSKGQKADRNCPGFSHHRTLQPRLHRVPTAVPLARSLHHTRATLLRLEDRGCAYRGSRVSSTTKRVKVSETGKGRSGCKWSWRHQTENCLGLWPACWDCLSMQHSLNQGRNQACQLWLALLRVAVPLWGESTPLEGMEPVWIQPKGLLLQHPESWACLQRGRSVIKPRFTRGLAAPLHLHPCLLRRWQLTTHPRGTRHPCSLRIQLSP